MEWTRDQELRNATVRESSIIALQRGPLTHLSIKIETVVDLWLCPARPEPLNTILAVVVRAPRPGHPAPDPANRIAVLQCWLPWADQSLPSPGPSGRWLAAAAVEIDVPALWPGQYSVYTTIHAMVRSGPWDPAHESPGKELCNPTAGLMTVPSLPAPALPAKRPSNGLAIEETNLTVAIPDATRTTAPLIEGFLFTLGLTGYPMLELSGGAAAEMTSVRALAFWLHPFVRGVEDRIREIPIWELPFTIFSPIFRDIDRVAVSGPVAGTLARVDARATSEKLASMAIGAGEGALKRTDAVTREYGLKQAIATGIEAIQWDPNNLVAYLWVAWLGAQSANAHQALGCFLTLSFRLRLLDRLLADMTDSYWSAHRDVGLACVRPLDNHFWATLRSTALILALDAKIDLEFPHLRSTCGP